MYHIGSILPQLTINFKTQKKQQQQNTSTSNLITRKKRQKLKNELKFLNGNLQEMLERGASDNVQYYFLKCRAQLPLRRQFHVTL